MIAQDSSYLAINGCGQFECITQTIRKTFVRTFNNDSLTWLSIEKLQFSPNGRYLSFHTKEAYPGEQLWVYDLISKSVSLVTELGTKGLNEVVVSDSKWISSDTILALLHTYGSSGGAYHFIKTTFQGKIEEIPPPTEYDEFVDIEHTKWNAYLTSPSGNYRVIGPLEYKNPISLINLRQSNRVFFKMKYNNGYFLWTADEQYLVFAEMYGSGMYTVKAARVQPKYEPFDIDTNNVDHLIELTGLCTSPNGHLVLYPHIFKSECIIMDLAKRKTVAVVKSGENPMWAAWSSQNILALVCRRCKIPSEPFKKEIGIVSPNEYEIYLLKLPKLR